jgi:hypothetical protein
MNRFEKRRAELQPKWAVILTNVNHKFRTKLAEILDNPRQIRLRQIKSSATPLEFRIAVLLRRSRQLHYGRLPAHSKGAAKEIAVLRPCVSRFERFPLRRTAVRAILSLAQQTYILDVSQGLGS